jgi:hypothetical protein
MARTALQAIAWGFLLAGAHLAQAASIGLAKPTGPDPSLFLQGGALTYSYVPICTAKSGAATGICGTKKGKKLTSDFTDFSKQQWNLTYGKMTIAGTNEYLTPCSNCPNVATPTTVPVGGKGQSKPEYSLTVIFGFGGPSAISGVLVSDPWSGDTLYSSNLLAKGTTGITGFTSGTLVSGTPTNATLPPYNKAYDFGYSGANQAGTFEFVFNNIGGDFRAFSSNQGGIIATTTTLSRIGSTPTTDWDLQGIAFWQSNFTAMVDVDTFVPIPAAVWLFGSALGVMGVMRRKISA